MVYEKAILDVGLTKPESLRVFAPVEIWREGKLTRRFPRQQNCNSFCSVDIKFVVEFEPDIEATYCFCFDERAGKESRVGGGLPEECVWILLYDLVILLIIKNVHGNPVLSHPVGNEFSWSSVFGG